MADGSHAVGREVRLSHGDFGIRPGGPGLFVRRTRVDEAGTTICMASEPVTNDGRVSLVTNLPSPVRRLWSVSSHGTAVLHTGRNM